MVLHPATSAENASCTPTPWQKKIFLHPATSIDNASCTPTPWQKNTILSQFIQFQHYGEKDTLAYREMKLLLPGGRGAGGIISWGGRVQKHFFLPGGRGAGGIFSWGGRVQNHFSDLKFFFEIQFKNTLNLIFPSFKVPSKSFLFKNFKTGLTFWHMWFFNFQNLVRSC